jgi:type III restriction enzyme
LSLGVPEEAIASYTAKEPKDDLLAVARDESKEVLIFKVAAALGFDAPRAFTLVSLRGTKSTDFGIQVVGRILRVHSYLQPMAANKTLPEVLRFGYVFLADAESQGGLIGAGAKINAIATQMAEITPYTMVVKVGDQREVQVSANGQTSLLPQPYVAPVWQAAETGSGNTPPQTSYVIGSTMPILDDWLMPQIPQIKEPGAVASNRPVLAGSSRFALREGLPNRFKTERLPLGGCPRISLWNE